MSGSPQLGGRCQFSKVARQGSTAGSPESQPKNKSLVKVSQRPIGRRGNFTQLIIMKQAEPLGVEVDAPVERANGTSVRPLLTENESKQSSRPCRKLPISSANNVNLI